MADAGFFKGTSADQDRRFSDKELKLLKSMKFPSEFDKKVDMRKVNVQVIRPWIAKKVTDLVGFEDEVVVEYAMGLLEDPSQPTPDPKKMQINLTGFLTNSTPSFMSALWNLLLEAQDSPAGVPRTFVEEKKEEMRKAREGDSRAIDERDRRARLDEIRQNERGNRGGGRGRGRGRGRGGFDDDRGGRGRDSGWGGRGGGVSGSVYFWQALYSKYLISSVQDVACLVHPLHVVAHHQAHRSTPEALDPHLQRGVTALHHPEDVHPLALPRLMLVAHVHPPPPGAVDALPRCLHLARVPRCLVADSGLPPIPLRVTGATEAETAEVPLLAGAASPLMKDPLPAPQAILGRPHLPQGIMVGGGA
ncbi:PWI domain-containing protein [Leucogyrophana mollusca]|uniref:PWI domain-containing protein n=1 Tax=Leucogyrophana mollusca TaxID=85980 RepID=A0ACB8BRN5_9AGAM|nr:PWI domain-containing protein [Leucogyrophana mollusca]